MKKFLHILSLLFALLFVSKEIVAQTCVTNPGATWSVPAGVTTATVYCIGGGGGSGGCVLGTNDQASGGGGGGGSAMGVITVSFGQTYNLTVGPGGTAGAATGTAGGTGGTTTFTGLGGTVTALGGAGGGGAASNGAFGAGGAGGAAGTGGYAGGAGTGGVRTTSNEVGGAGGGGAGSGGAGGAGTSGSAASNTTGGTGGIGTYSGGAGAGASTTTDSNPGVAGNAPGGGAAGAASYSTAEPGAIGGAGQIVICYFTCTAPAITVAAAPASQTICQNTVPTNLTLTATGTGLTYQWYSNIINSNIGGTSVGAGSGGQTNTFTPPTTSAGTTYYYCVVTGTCGTATSAAVTVIVTAAPVVAAIGGGAASVCVGSTTAAFTDGTAGGVWSVTNGTGSATISAGGVVTGVTPGSVTVNYSKTSGGCTTTVTAALTVNGTAVAAIGGGAASVCVGSTTAAFTDASAGGTWSITNGTGSATISAGGVATGVTPGSATVNYVVVSGGCTNSVTTALTINGTVIAAIGGGAASVCMGSTTAAFTDATAGGTWSITNGTGSATISAGGVATGVTAGSVTVNYTIVSGGCTNVVTYALTVNSNVVAAIGGGAASVCMGSTTPAFTDATAGGTWSITNGTGSATISAGGVATGVTAGSVTVNYTVGSGSCTNVATYALTVTGCSGTPTGGAAEPSVTAGCASYASTITLSGSSTGCGVTYQWQSSPDNTTWTNIGGATSLTYNATITSSIYYHCIVTCSGSGLTATSASGYCQFGAATNDACSTPVAAGVVTTTGYDVQGDNSCATINTGGTTDPTPTCQFVNHAGTLWYTFTTPAYAASYSISLVPNSLTYGAMTLYSNTCGAFTQVACADAGVSFQVQNISTGCLPANTTYYVMVFTDGGTAGSFYLSISSPSCNGGNAVATTVSQCSAGNYASTISLSNTSGCLTAYQWQSSTNNSTWSNVGGATSSTYAATISSSIYYQCVVTCSSGGTYTSTSVYCSAPNTAPTNDACANAIALTFQPGINLGDYLANIEGDNTCATADGTSSCFSANKSIWYKFVAPVTGSYNTMLVTGTMQWPELSIKGAGTTCAGFTEVSCAGADNAFNNIYQSYGEACCFHGAFYATPADDSPNGYSSYSQTSQYYAESGICNVTAGQTVYIMVDNNPNGSSGTFTLTVGTLENDNIPNGVVVNNCGSVFNSSTIGATNCGNCEGAVVGGTYPASYGLQNDFDCNTGTVCSGGGNASCGDGLGNAGNSASNNGSDVGYSVENDSWYQFCVAATANVSLNFTPIASSCLPSNAKGGSGGLQISAFTGTSGNLTKVGGGFAGMSITSAYTMNFALTPNQCAFIEVDGYAGTNCNYQLAITMSPSCVLPVDILSFTGILTNDIRAKLNWVTASEENSDHYLIERSTDGLDYTEVVGTVKAVGHSTKQTGYEIYDNHPAKGTNYYKLTEFDKNGVSNFLGYTTVNNRASLPLIHLYPNPAQNSITLNLKNFSSPTATYELYDAQGVLRSGATISLIDGNQDYKIDLSNLTNGFYFIKVIAGDELLKKTFIKAE
jgi:hypothetical protein